MQQILVYADSLSWGIIPDSRRRLEFSRRWPGVLEGALLQMGHQVRVVENCLNGRRTVWEDPFKPGRNGSQGIGQVIEMHSPLRLVLLMLGSNDFQSVHSNTAWHSAQGIAVLVAAIRGAPIEPGMPVPDIMIIAPPLTAGAKGGVAEKFAGAEARSAGLAREYEKIAADLGCMFFDANSVVSVSRIDGVHLDQPEHESLGLALASECRVLLR